MSEVIVGVFATQTGSDKKVIHGLMPVAYGEFYMRLVSNRYAPDWRIFLQDDAGNGWGSMQGRKKNGSESVEVEAGSVRKLRSAHVGRGSV